MSVVIASIGITPEQSEKCRKYRINRSAIARRAIEDEIKRIETGDIVAKPAPAVAPSGGHNELSC